MTSVAKFRPLSNQEKFFALGNVTVHYTISGSGVIDPHIMKLAFDTLHTQFPLLNGNIEYLCTDQSLMPDLAFRIPSSQPESNPFFYYDYAYNPAEALGAHVLIACDRMIVLELYQTLLNPQRYTVAAYIRHSISDAKNGIALLHRLWELYTEQVIHGSLRNLSPSPIAQSYEDIIRERNIVSIPLLDPEVFLETPPLYSIPEINNFPVVISPPERILFTEELSAALKRKGKEHGLTINSLITAAVIIAEFEWLEYAGKPNPSLVLNTMVDLRSCVGSPVSATQVTNFLGNSFFAADKKVLEELIIYSEPKNYESAIIAYGSQIKNKLVDDIDSRYVHAFTQTNGNLAVSEHSEKKLLTISLTHTNWGVISEFAAPEGIVHDDFRGWNMLAPYLEVNSLLTLAIALVYKSMIFTSTFQNRISVDIIQQEPFYPSDSARFIAERMYTILSDWVSG